MLEHANQLTDKTIDRLNDLIRLNIDSSEGLEAAAADVNDASLRTLFHDIAPERRANAEELRQLVQKTGRRPEDSGSALGSMHREWMSLRARLSSNGSRAVLSEAERGEDTITHTYQDILIETAGSPVNNVLQRQYATVKRGHDRIRNLRDRFGRQEHERYRGDL